MRAESGDGRASAAMPVARFVVIYLVLLYTIPARLVVPGFGAAGAPASLLALGAAALYLASFVHPQIVRASGANPVRFLLLGYLGVVLLSWTIGKASVLSSLAATTSDRAMIKIIGLAGLSLVVMDGVRTWTELEIIVRRIVQLSIVMVLVGLLQFFVRIDLTRYMEVPGLVANRQGITTIPRRSIFNRPFGTALHPIEFGVVCAALVPLAIRHWLRSRGIVPLVTLLLISFAAMASISRSAVLGLAVVGAVLFVGMGWRERANLAAASLCFVVAAGSVVPGLVGTLRSLFTNADSDPSVQSRLNRVPRVLDLIAEHPWLGRGYGTYTPEEYFLLDNEIQKMAIESGVIGVLAFVVLVVGVVWVAATVRRRGPDQRSLGLMVAATILAITISSYTFDAFFYHILSGVLYLSIGIVGAAWRLTMESSEDGTPMAADADAGRRLAQELS